MENMHQDKPGFAISLVGLAISLALTLGVGAIGGWVTTGSVSTWYAALVKPGFNPPDWVFGPVWTTLYVLMGFAAWRVWRAVKTLRHKAFALYSAQLGLNLLWSILFFGLHRIGLAMADLIALLAALLATGVSFARIDRIAGWCFVPYALWVGYAGVLNAALWWLN
jgi:tryptophan-rich sensory protein